MNTAIHSFSEQDIAAFLGIHASDLSEEIRALIQKTDLRYREMEKSERDQVMLGILKRLESPTLSVSGVGEKERWIRGWNENLDLFIKSGYDESSLIPKYIKPNHPVRLRGDYVMPLNENFERDFLYIIRQWMFAAYLSDHNPIYEFGCGTGANLAELARMYPEKELHGSDWIDVPKKIIDLLAEKKGYNMKGHVFDMFSPDESFPLKEGAAILAVNSLEQIGEKFEPFLQFILSKKPSIFVHFDSFMEFYNENNLPDYITLMHNHRRNYLSGYLTRLRELEKQGVIDIVKAQHVVCGGLYHDYYSFVVWKMHA
ncbi:MAG: class I SAM-dependent methyltransferase [bacterium]|nr:class I SAM-dependent methyltransferase [bacterium]MDZ4286114.1 class I SAM-dependent methyltransferase [Candidatus Sungbacteria bacterium]